MASGNAVAVRTRQGERVKEDGLWVKEGIRVSAGPASYTVRKAATEDRLARGELGVTSLSPIRSEVWLRRYGLVRGWTLATSARKCLSELARKDFSSVYLHLEKLGRAKANGGEA